MKPATTAAASANDGSGSGSGAVITSASGILVLACVAVDGAIATAILIEDRPALIVLVLLAVHLVISAVSGFAVSNCAPPYLKVTKMDLAAFAGFVATFIPIFGSLGVFIALLFGFTPPRRTSREPWITFDVAKDFEEGHRHPQKARRRNVSAVEIGVALRKRTPKTADYRFRSVLAIQRLPVRVGIPLLKMAQSDPVDEIRLYAFSRLEKMRDDLEKQVKALTTALQTAEKAEEPRLHLRLAESYWELGYLGLAEGAVLDHALKMAHRHAAIACELLPEHSAAEFFLGRILVFLKESERAQIAFERAMTAGYPRIKVLPYLAECAFLQRNYKQVRTLLRELDSSSPENLFFRSVMDFWQEQQSERPPPPPGSRTSLHISKKSLAALRVSK